MFHTGQHVKCRNVQGKRGGLVNRPYRQISCHMFLPQTTTHPANCEWESVSRSNGLFGVKKNPTKKANITKHACFQTEEVVFFVLMVPLFTFFF